MNSQNTSTGDFPSGQQSIYAASYTNPGPGAGFGSGYFPGDSGDYNYDEDNDNDNDNDGNGNDASGGDGGRDPKRRRIARACDMCRKKKIKCDGKSPKCSHCENSKTECVFTQVEKKRNPPKGAKYIEGLENRLGRMESLLKMSGLLAEEDWGRTDLGTLEKKLAERSQSMTHSRSNAGSPASPTSQRTTANQVATPASNGTPRDAHLNGASPAVNATAATAAASPEASSKLPAPKPKQQVDALADQMCSLITNNCGETRYIGSSSGFSIFSPKGIQWVNEKTGDSSFQHMIASATEDGQKFDHWKPEVFSDLFARRTFKALPPRAECYSLLRDYFQNFNNMFPLFHEPTFMHLVDKHYSLDPYEGSGWWASLNVALAIAHRLRVMSNITNSEEDEHAWGYLKNAMAVLSELTMRNTDLLSVQALLGMALFLSGTPNPQPSFFLVAAAMRLAHSIGLHKRGSGFNLNEVENEQRKRVFWIAYLLDKDICLRSGRPPAQDDDDMNVDLPSDDPSDDIGNIPLAKEENGRATMNLFRQMCTFAQIQSQVYKRLYSVKASQQTDGQLLNTIGELDSLLEEWKDSMPLDFRPEHEIKASHTPLILHVVVLHFAYYNCLTTIHRMSVHHGYWTSRLSDFALQGLNARPLNPRVFMSAALCVNAARTSIGLIRYIPQGDYACVWLILYYPVSALVTLFANILQNPQDARARSDLKLMASVVAFLTMLERDSKEGNGNVRRMLGVCSEFERIARVVLDKAEREMKGRGKRKQAEREQEKDRRQPDGHAVGEIIDGGKSWEQLQIETQAAYRRPVQTPSLRASMATSPGSGGSPATWGTPNSDGNPRASFAAPQHDANTQQQQPQPGPQGYIHQSQDSNGQWNSSPFQMPTGPSPNLNTVFPPDWQSLHQATQQHQQRQQQQNNPTQGPFSNSNSLSVPGTMMDDFGTNSATSFVTTPDTIVNGNMPMGNTGGSSSAFQQPFVPQDLWQMPMTLEWDWAEGLGLGSFTPGPMFDNGGGYMGGHDPMGGQPNGGQ